MKITLNELRNIVRNILKENINYPEDFNLANEQEALSAWKNFQPKLKDYIKSNLKVLNTKGEYGNNFEFKTLGIGRYDDTLKAFSYFELLISAPIAKSSMELFIAFFSSANSVPASDLRFQVELRGYRGAETDNGNIYFFESQKDLDLIVDVCKNVAETFMGNGISFDTDFFNQYVKQNGYNSNFLVNPESNLSSSEEPFDSKISSSDFRRGGEMNFGGKSGGYKGKFPQKGSDNYDEWIGDVESSKKFAIETLYDLVKDGGIPPKKFNEKVKNILSSSSNKQSKFSSSDFRRGGEMSFGKSGDYKGKFPQKGFDNYDEWIGDVESSKRLAIETLYDLVNDGGIPPKKFNEKVKNILSSPLNELRNIIKKLITELKWSDRIEIYNEPVTYEEKKKWEGNYYKYYDDWMPLLEYFEIYEGASKDARIFARQLYSAVGYGNMTRDAFNRAIENKSKEDRWGIEITKEDREEEQTREKEAREKFAKEKRF